MENVIRKTFKACDLVKCEDDDEAMALPQPNVSKHLKILRDAGLVQVRVDGPSRIYSLDPAPLAELDSWLAPFRRFWADKLDALGDHLSRSD